MSDLRDDIDISMISESEDKPLVAVIITLCKGNSYDKVYSTVRQEHPEGAVHVWRAGTDQRTIQAIISSLQGKPVYGLPKQFPLDIHTEGVNITVNFECCSGYSRDRFGKSASDILQLTKLILDEGHLVMFSDFSLKALINDWDESLLGPKAFIATGSFRDNFTLRFDPKSLKQCTLGQLQTVGELGSEEGRAVIKALPNTICFSLSDDAKISSEYTVEVLTVQNEWGDSSIELPEKDTVTIGEHTGAIGHAILTYPSGGQLVVQSGHWIELSRLDVSSIDAIIETGRLKYGDDYADSVKADLESCKTVEERGRRSQRYVKGYVTASSGYTRVTGSSYKTNSAFI